LISLKVNGIEIPRYANTKFSVVKPIVSTRYSIVILPQVPRE
jgi:hypothetical protein